jgi:hypothetical protein
MSSTAAVMSTTDAQTALDNRLLRWLVRLHYLAAIVTACFAISGARYIGPGRQMLRDPGGPLPPLVEEMLQSPIIGPMLEPMMSKTEDRPIFGGALYLMGAAMVTLSLVHGAALAFVGRLIARRRRRGLCIGFSIFDLMYVIPVPIGAGLSIFALVMLLRPSVAAQFKAGKSRRATDDQAAPEIDPPQN